MEKIKLGISYLDQLINRFMIILEWEIECQLFGKDKDIIISLHATKLITIQITSRTLIIQMIQKVYGHMFIIHIVQLKRKLLHSYNMEILNQIALFIKLLIQKIHMLNSFQEEKIITDILHLMVFSNQLFIQLLQEFILDQWTDLKHS